MALDATLGEAGRIAVPAAPPSRTAWVAAQLRRDILSGAIPPGTKLRGRVLAERYTISPTPLREALQLLSAEGLVEATPQHGARVSSLDLGEALDLYELRLLLEPRAVQRSLRRAPDQRFTELESAYQRFEGPDGGGDFHEGHNDFHRLMRVDCDSAWLLRIVDQLTVNCERYRRLRGLSEAVHEEHRELAAACAARDARLAARLMREHIAITRDKVKEAMHSAAG